MCRGGSGNRPAPAKRPSYERKEVTAVINPSPSRRRRALYGLALTLAACASALITYTVGSLLLVVSEVASEPAPAELPAELVPATPPALAAAPAAAPAPAPGTAAAAPAPPKSRRTNILVLGVDQNQVLTDVILLVNYDPADGTVRAVWVPRDTRTLLVPQGIMEKVNHAYAYGEGERYLDPAVRAERPFRSMKTVGRLLGVDVHYHVTVNFDAYRLLIDDLGSVEVDVPFDMDYDDPYQDLSIHLKQGRRRLNGEEALGLARWRRNNDWSVSYPNGDLGRIRTQQKLLAAILDQALTARNLPRLPGIAAEAARHVRTNMDRATLTQLARQAAQLKPAHVQLLTVAGEVTRLPSPIYTEEGPQSYLIPDPEKLQALRDLLNAR